MAINNIKIKAHDIHIEKDNDKGGNLTVSENTTTKTLNVTEDTINNGNLTVSKNINANGANIGTDGLTVGTSNNEGNVNIHGSIHLYGNAARNISCNNGLNITAQGLAVNSAGNLSLITGSLNNIGISSPTITVTTNTLKINGTTTTQSLTVNANIAANGATIGDGGLNVNTTTTTNTLNVNTINISTNGGLTINGSNGNLTVAGNTNTNTLNVTGATNTNTLNVNTTTTTNTLNVNAINVTGTKTFTLSVSNSKLNISGDLNVQGAITSSQNIVMSSINATGDLNVGTNTNSANVNVFGNISINDNIVLRQDASETEIIVGSNDKPLKLFGSGDRPSYSKNGEGNINIALANDIYNPTITIKQAGEEKGSFTLNQSDAKTIELTDTTYTPGTGLGLSTDNKFYVKTNYATDGTNYQVTTDDSGNLYVAVPWTNVATTSSNGLMSSTDKSKLDGIAENANNYSLPVATSEALGGIKVGYSSNGTKYAVELDSDKAYVNVPWTNVATTSTNGLMSSTDKSKLDGIAKNATANIGTITKIKMNGQVKGESGEVDLGTVITAHQDISGKADKSYVDSNYVNISTNQTISGTKTFNNAVKGVGGFVIEGTRYGTTQTTTYDNGQISYSRATNGHLESACTYSLPTNKSGTLTFAMTDELKSYLPLSGGIVTGMVDFDSIVNFSNELAMIAFNKNGHYVTNMICGKISLVLSGASGSYNSCDATFNDGKKGEGSWHVVATAEGYTSEYSTVAISGVSESGFKVTVRNNASNTSVSQRTLTIHYVAVKYI